MRASIRGSIRRVIVTDSETSDPAATADSIRRKSRRFSAQKAASASSLSKSGTSSQLEMEFMADLGRAESLVHPAVVKIFLLGFEGTRVNDADGLAVRAINAENS